MTTTYNNPDCTCGLDHDDFPHIISAVMQALQQYAEQTHREFTSMDVGANVEEAARRVGWYRDVDKAETSFNSVDCVCDLDHDDIAHIVATSLDAALASEEDVTMNEVTVYIQETLAKVGWVKA